jgi:hypothetical protein
LWVAFLDPSNSYFLFADLVGFYTHWTYMHIFRHIFLSNYWWQRSDIWSQAVQKHFPQYGVPIWTLWPNIRFLPSIVAEKNATKNVHICSMSILWVAFLDPSNSYFLFADLVGFYTHWTYMHIFRRIFLSNYWWQRSDIWSQASYRYPISWEAFFDPSDSYFFQVEICSQQLEICKSVCMFIVLTIVVETD